MRATVATLIAISFFGLAGLVQGLDHVKFGASRVIQPNPCGHERTGEEGVCMFAWDCLNLNGTHITFCRDRFYYGSCCKLPDGVQAPNRMPPSVHNSPSNHLDASTRRPTPAPTTMESVGVPFDKDGATARPPVVEVQFPRDPTPRPTIPPAVPTSYPIVPPTTQRRPIVVNNHHKKPGHPIKGTTVSSTPRPRPTEEVTTMAITEVPTGKPTWIIADEADKNGHPTPATPETTPTPAPSSAPTTTEQPPSTVATTETASAVTTTAHPAVTETTPRTTDEFTQTPTALADVTTTSAAELTTPAASATNPPTTVSHEENSIDVTTEAETTTRIFSTRYPIRFPPKEKPTTTTEVPDVTTDDEPSRTDSELVQDKVTTIESVPMATTGAAVGATTTLKAEEGPDDTAEIPSSTEASSETNADPSTEAPFTEAGSQLTTAGPSSEVATTLTPSTDVGEETSEIPKDDATTTSETIVPSTDSPTSSTTMTPEVSLVPDEGVSDDRVTTIAIPVQPETTTLIPETTTEYDPIKSICGRPKAFATGRIVGGDMTHFGKWPWMISLRQFKKNTFVHKCGAALLNEYWAVSAAHCVHNVSPNDIILRLGEYDLSGHDKEPLGHIERRVQIVATHPKFDAHTFEYDLALMRFYEPVSFADNIVPICIADGNRTYVDQTAVVTGWGRLYEDGPLPSVLQKVRVPIITNKECERMYRKAGFIEDIPDIFICAGISSGGKDSCEGDSGGPLVLKDEDSGAWNLIGIISWGIGCALPNQPGVYTRITKFSDWMKQIIIF